MRGLHAAPLAHHAGPGQVAEHVALEGREERLRACRRWQRGSGGAATGGGGDGWGQGAVVVVLEGELGHFALAMAVVEDEQREAGVAEQAPGLSRMRRAREGQEGGVLLAPQVEHQTGQRGQQGGDVMSVCAVERRRRPAFSTNVTSTKDFLPLQTKRAVR